MAYDSNQPSADVSDRREGCIFSYHFLVLIHQSGISALRKHMTQLHLTRPVDHCNAAAGYLVNNVERCNDKLVLERLFLNTNSGNLTLA